MYREERLEKWTVPIFSLELYETEIKKGEKYIYIYKIRFEFLLLEKIFHVKHGMIFIISRYISFCYFLFFYFFSLYR